MRKLAFLCLALMAVFIVAPSVFADGCNASRTCSDGSVVSCGGSSTCSVGSTSVTCDGATTSCPSGGGGGPTFCMGGASCTSSSDCGFDGTCSNYRCLCY